MLRYTCVGVILCCTLLSHAEDTVSTNPCRPFVDEFALPNYDTALDVIDHSQPYEKITWPWETHAKQKEEHEATLNYIRQNADARVLVLERPQNKCQSLIFQPIWDETCEEYEYHPKKIDNAFLEKTFPFLPEVNRLTLVETGVTDEGLRNIFYLPKLKRYDQYRHSSSIGYAFRKIESAHFVR
ncbi:MAG: hypothetical protein Q4D98_07120 [Planctomycetia bacterium]|nr:hypothetical protein [Planctomycetia bacterium]